jgi:hypothetical protein
MDPLWPARLKLRRGGFGRKNLTCRKCGHNLST